MEVEAQLEVDGGAVVHLLIGERIPHWYLSPIS
jgi:hypothetical protein